MIPEPQAIPANPKSRSDAPTSDGAHLPPVANGCYEPVDARELKVGDCIKQKSDPFFYKFKSYDPSRKIVLASFKLFSGKLRVVELDANSILRLSSDFVDAQASTQAETVCPPAEKRDLKSNLPPEPEQEFKVGDEVKFAMYWNGVTAQQSGVITEIDPHDIKGVVRVKFCPENSVGVGEVQLPIQKIALRSSESVALPPGPQAIRCKVNDKEFSIGDRVFHKKSPSEIGEVVRLANNKAYVQWETQSKPVAYRVDNLAVAIERREFNPENIRRDYPTMTQVGLLQPIGGSWKSSSDWACPDCGGKKRFVIWEGIKKLDKRCLNCWETRSKGTAGHRVLDNAVGDEPTNQAAPTQNFIKIGNCTNKQPETINTKTGKPQSSAIAHSALTRIKNDAAKVPPEPKTIEAQIAAIRSQGPIAPEGVWIETCSVSKEFRQAYWRSRDPCFKPKRSGGNPEAKVRKSYIGKENSPAHTAAKAQVERRNQILKLERKNGNGKQ